MNYKSITRNSRIHFAAILFIYDSKTFAQPCQVAGPGPGPGSAKSGQTGPGPDLGPIDSPHFEQFGFADGV